MATRRKSRHISHASAEKDDTTGTNLLPLPALGGLVTGLLTFFLGGEVTLSTRPHPLHWLTAAGGGAFFYLVGLFYARRQATHPHRKVRR